MRISGGNSTVKMLIITFVETERKLLGSVFTVNEETTESFSKISGLIWGYFAANRKKG